MSLSKITTTVGLNSKSMLFLLSIQTVPHSSPISDFYCWFHSWDHRRREGSIDVLGSGRTRGAPVSVGQSELMIGHTTHSLSSSELLMFVFSTCSTTLSPTESSTWLTLLMKSVCQSQRRPLVRNPSCVLWCVDVSTLKDKMQLWSCCFHRGVLQIKWSAATC